MSTPTDKQMLDWLQGQAGGYGEGWICRWTYPRNRMRLSEIVRVGADYLSTPDIRDAIAAAMEKQRKDEHD